MKKLLITLSVLGIGANLFSQTYLNESFENGFPSGWTQSTLATDGGWNWGNATSLSSTYFPIPTHTNFVATNDDDCNCDKSADRLETPVLNLSNATSVFLKFDAFYAEGSYNNVFEDFDIVVSIDGGMTWSASVYDVPDDPNAWKTYIVDLSTYVAGQSNVKIGFLYNDGGDWLYGAAIDNVVIYTPASYDVGVTAETMPDYLQLSNAPFTITGVFTNYGTQTVTSIDLSYSVNGGTPVTATGISTNVSTLQTGNFSHPTGWTPATAGTYTIKAWIDLINGNADQNNSNDTLTWTVTVVDTMVPRTTLMEVFTSSTCGPCAPANAHMESLLPSLSNYTVIKYQQDFPGSGDPYATTESVARRSYYAINSIPRMEIDGQWDQHAGNLTTSIYNQYNSIPSFMSISIDSAYYSGNNVTVKATINPVINYPSGNYRYHVVIVERKTTGNVKTNGETEFFNVMMDMIPNQNGNTISALNANSPVIVNKTANMSSTHVEEMSDLRAVVFVQNNNDKKVLQSAWKDISTATGITSVIDNKGIYAVYPNPAVDLLNVKFITGANESIFIRILDINGKEVLTQNAQANTNTNYTTIDVSNIPSGVYFVQLQTRSQTYTSKFFKK